MELGDTLRGDVGLGGASDDMVVVTSDPRLWPRKVRKAHSRPRGGEQARTWPYDDKQKSSVVDDFCSMIEIVVVNVVEMRARYLPRALSHTV